MSLRSSEPVVLYFVLDTPPEMFYECCQGEAPAVLRSPSWEMRVETYNGLQTWITFVRGDGNALTAEEKKAWRALVEDWETRLRRRRRPA